MQEITSHVGSEETYSICIEEGEIVRVTYMNTYSKTCFIPETKISMWDSKFLESDIKYIWWFSTLCTLRVYSEDDFLIISKEAIKKTGHYNLNGLREIHDCLNSGVCQEYCREVQKELQELLNW